MKTARRVPWCALVLIVLLGCLTPILAAASGRYDPRLRFRTISTPRFDIHFHQGEEAQARRLAALAEAVAAALDKTLGPASGRVQVILVDQSDLSNGWATPLPYNTIEIAAAAPSPGSLIGNTDDWLQLVFAHEYTHIVHLSRGKGWIGGLRKAMGRMPLLYPNLYLPAWQIEGLAVHEESAVTGQGRIPDRNFRALVDVAAGANRFAPLDRANGGLVDWPAGQTPYAYGAFFHEFLKARYGEAALRQLTDATAGRIPYLGSRAFKKLFGRSLGDLWREFEESSHGSSAAPAAAVTRLTNHGFNVSGPRVRDDGAVYYSIANPDGFPSLMARSLDGGQPRRVANRYLGAAVSFAGSRVVFDQMEIENQIGLQSDLYSVDAAGRSVTRLTRGARAGAPDVSPDGRTIVCTIQQADRRALATLTLEPQSGAGVTILASEAGVHYGLPRWSPDGRRIAAERVSLEGRSEIVLIDPDNGRLIGVASSAANSRSITPAWLPDGRLLFASDRGGDGFRLYTTSVDTGATSRLDVAGANATSPAPSPDGRTLVYVGYTPDGYDLFSVQMTDAQWTPIAPQPAEPTRNVSSAITSASSETPTRTYSPLRTIAPRFWTPTLESDEGEVVVGAAIGSTDALGRHVYGAEVGWGGRARPDWQLAYAYDRWRPTFFLNVADDTDPWRDDTIRTVEANAGLLFPVRRVRWSQSFLAAIHSSKETLTCPSCPGAAEDTGELRSLRRALRFGWIVDDARSYGYSISREDGWTMRVTTELTRASFGADGDAEAATFDIRGYLPVMPEHGVIAARFAVAASQGDPSVRRMFSASGTDPQTLTFDFGSDAVGLVRGLDSGDLLGTRAAVVNLDYRLPFKQIERGVGTLPIFARVVHGSVFVDAGHAWTSSFSAADPTVALGAQFSLDAVVGYVLPLTFTTGFSWVSQGHGFAWFGTIGRFF